jgi:hypothetical protein
MANCIDCLHFEVCQYDEQERAEANLEPSYRDLSKYIADGCKFFKNKADFVEVKHGWWKDTEYGTCSVCNRSISEIYDADSSMAYGILDEITACPFCGADMRKEGADNG